MARLSRRALDPRVESKLIRDFSNLLNELSDHERAYFLDKLLTRTEMLMLAKRLAILKELGRGSLYEEIERKLKVIPATIARMSSISHQSPKLSIIIGKASTAGSEKKRPSRSAGRVVGSRTLAGARRLLS
jgi:uncharacterized protein YerC